MTNVENKFKIITDSKDEPDLKAAQEFVGGMVRVLHFLMVII